MAAATTHCGYTSEIFFTKVKSILRVLWSIKKKKSVQQLIDIKYYRSTISSIGKVLILKKNHEKTSIGSINIKEYVGGKAVVIGGGLLGL